MGPALNLPNGAELIDPGMLEDFQGKHWLFMSDNYCFPLSGDGLHITGPGIRVLEDENFRTIGKFREFIRRGHALPKGWMDLSDVSGWWNGRSAN